MVKRRVIEESDEEQESERDVTPPKSKRAKREGKARVRDESDASVSQDDDMRNEEGADKEIDDEELDEQQPEDEATFEQNNEHLIRAAIVKKNRRVTVAQSGVIHSIDVKNFMCHRRLTFNFGPQVNFIIGRNGSGKSAVLAAVQIGLGGKTINTGRGSGLSNFIYNRGKKGTKSEAVAEITIKLKNSGSEAYKPDVYGDMIIIHRKFTAKSSSWAIKDSEGKTIGTSKRHLQEISDAMNIQIDSPLNVLTQEVAKKFLVNSTAADKYVFFLKGTQLAQLSEEYELIREASQRNDKFIQAKRDILPDLKAAHKEADRKRSEASKARDQADKLMECKKEQAWGHVACKSAELKKVQKDYDAQVKVQQAVIRKLEEVQASLAEHEAKCAEAEAAMPSHDELDAINTERSTLHDQIKANRNHIGNNKAEETRINQDLKAVKAVLEETEMKIAEEQSREMDDKAEEKERLRQQIEHIKTQLAETEADIQDSRQQRGEAEHKVNNLETSISGAKRDYDKHQRIAEDIRGQIAHLRGIEKNKLSAFGNNVDKILEEIQQRTWKGQATPIGPLGLYVTLKDKDFKDVLQIQLGRTMMSFAVSHLDDRRQLEAILKRYQNQQPIIVAEPDIFDYSSGVPKDDRILTPLNILTFTNDWALRLFINAHRIERTALAHNHEQAKAVAARYPGNNIWSADCYQVINYRDGGWKSDPMTKLKPNDPKNALFGESDVNSAIQEAEAKLTEVGRRLETIKSTGQRMQAEQRDAQGKVGEQRAREQQAHAKSNRLRRDKEALDEQVKDKESVSIAALMSHKSDYENEKANLIAQFEEAVVQKERYEQLNRPLVERYNELRNRRDAIEVEIEEHRSRLQQMVEETLTVKNRIPYYNNKLTEAEKALEVLQLKLNKTQEEYASWYQQAADYCDEVLNPRDPKKIQLEMDALNSALKQRERRHGATVDEIEHEYHRTKKAVEDAEKDAKAFADFNKVLKQSLAKRLEKWHAFRMSIALRAKIQFQYRKLFHLVSLCFLLNLLHQI
ncbi:Structural maintenance of chromosomes protein 6 [Tulasnella sp. 419]|nr:Structural maintenance of chromosomes protein 6 [Tulasnella sp. 419]